MLGRDFFVDAFTDGIIKFTGVGQTLGAIEIAFHEHKVRRALKALQFAAIGPTLVRAAIIAGNGSKVQVTFVIMTEKPIEAVIEVASAPAVTADVIEFADNGLGLCLGQIRWSLGESLSKRQEEGSSTKGIKNFSHSF
jgi:hypothetical protein